MKKLLVRRSFNKVGTIIVALLLISITSNQMNCMDAWTDPYDLEEEIITDTEIKPKKQVHFADDLSNEDNDLYPIEQSHLGIDGATYQDMEQLKLLDRAQVQAMLKKYQYYIKEMKEKYSDNLIKDLNKYKPDNIPPFHDNAQIDITVTAEDSTSTVRSLRSNPKFNYDASNNTVTFDNTIIDNCSTYTTIDGTPYKGIIKIHVVDKK